jgi:hypothetical protein
MTDQSIEMVHCSKRRRTSRPAVWTTPGDRLGMVLAKILTEATRNGLLVVALNQIVWSHVAVRGTGIVGLDFVATG